MKLTRIVSEHLPDSVAIRIERFTTEQERGFRDRLEEAKRDLESGSRSAYHQLMAYLEYELSRYKGRFSRYFDNYIKETKGEEIDDMNR